MCGVEDLGLDTPDIYDHEVAKQREVTMTMYERIVELIEDAKSYLMNHDLYLEKLSLLLAEEVDELKEKVDALEERLKNYE